MKLPIDRISYSAITTYLSNPFYFYKKYVTRESEASLSPSALVGRCFHRFAELYYSKVPIEDAIKASEAMVTELAPTVRDWGATGSEEKALRELRNCIMAYLNEGLPWKHEHVIATEHVMQHKIRGFPVDLKCVTDLEVLDGDGEMKKVGYNVVDLKVVTSFTKAQVVSVEETPEGQVAKTKVLLPPNYWIQAFFGVTLATKEYKQRPKAFIFKEIKKTKNQDGAGQVQLVILKTDDPDVQKEFAKVKALIKMVLKDLSRRKVWFPNPNDMYDGEAAWDEWNPET